MPCQQTHTHNTPGGEAGNDANVVLSAKKNAACCRGRNSSQSCQPDDRQIDAVSKCKRKHGSTVFCLQKNMKPPVVAENETTIAPLRAYPYVDSSSKCKRRHGSTVFCLQKEATLPYWPQRRRRTSVLLDAALTFHVDGNVDIAQPLVCLQEERDAAFTSGTAIHDCRDCLARQRNRNACEPFGGAGLKDTKEAPKDVRNTSERPENASAVEKRLHIHRTGCAEDGFYIRLDVLSNIGAAPIQDFSSILEYA